MALIPMTGDPYGYISVLAPAEPHEFAAILRLKSGRQTLNLPFRMQEPEGHHH